MRPPLPPVWGFGGALLLAGWALGALAVAPFLTPATVDHAAGVVFAPTFGLARAIEAISHGDPSARILNISWHGMVVFVRYEDHRFPDIVARLGALHTFDAVAAGCHGGKQ